MGSTCQKLLATESTEYWKGDRGFWSQPCWSIAIELRTGGSGQLWGFWGLEDQGSDGRSLHPGLPLWCTVLSPTACPLSKMSSRPAFWLFIFQKYLYGSTKHRYRKAHKSNYGLMNCNKINLAWVKKRQCCHNTLPLPIKIPCFVYITAKYFFKIVLPPTCTSQDLA